jgi:hypothetical protein
MRATDGFREQTVSALGRGYAMGALGPDTFAQRLDAAYAARSMAELRALVADVPRGPAWLLRLREAWVARRALPALTVRGEVPLLVGRASACDVLVTHPSISRRHAVLVPGERGWSIQDLGSTNGTRVNGQRVDAAPLRAGDEIRLGSARFRFDA